MFSLKNNIYHQITIKNTTRPIKSIYFHYVLSTTLLVHNNFVFLLKVRMEWYHENTKFNNLKKIEQDF